MLERAGRTAVERAADVDGRLRSLAEAALGRTPELAVVATGGYGRGELSPHSDVDLLVLTNGRRAPVPATLRSLLYPLWDAGLTIGHAVRAPKEAINHARTSLDAATSLLSARMVAGDRLLFEELLDRRRRWLVGGARGLANRIAAASRDRHRRVERAGWSLAPDLKEDVGGLRDLHAVGWLEAVAETCVAPEELRAAGRRLLGVRDALHSLVKRPTDRVHIDLQPGIAERLGITGPDRTDRLMAEVHSSARAIEHHGALALERLVDDIGGRPRRSGVVTNLGGVRIEDGYLVATVAGNDPAGALRVVAAHAHTGRPVARSTCVSLARSLAVATPAPWSADLRAAFLDVLAGRHAASALELLDHSGGWPALMPEWMNIRGRAQHDPYHRYTVDGHSFLAVEGIAHAIEAEPLARNAVDEESSLHVLRLATLLHDIGKGSGDDHCIAGERMARSICDRMGLDPQESDDVAALVRHHLLLVDTATRRDLEDGDVIDGVASLIRSPHRLRFLYVLSIADARATGPEGWTQWKSTLVRELYRKVLLAMTRGELPIRKDVAERARELEAYDPSLEGRALGVLSTLPSSYGESVTVEDAAEDVRLLSASAEAACVGVRVAAGTEDHHECITVVVPDRPGTLARTAGVLALNRISVRTARAHSTTTGVALQRLVVVRPPEVEWASVTRDLDAAYSGRLALEARLERKSLDYRPARQITPELRILQDESPHSTVIEVRAADALGLLYAITAALGDLDLDIRMAKIDTLGDRVVDVFYVRDPARGKLDAGQEAEARRSIRHRVGRVLADGAHR